MENVLVTGGAGFIGSHLVQLLLSKGHSVVVLDNLASGSLDNLQGMARFVKGDIRNPDALTPHFKGIDWVFHLAALTSISESIERPREYFETNVTGTFNVLEAAKKAGVKRFVYAASSSCYGMAQEYPTSESAPISLLSGYALTKYLGETLVLHEAAVPAVSLRLFNVFGPRSRGKQDYDPVFGIFLTQKLHGKPLTIIGDGTQTRDFVYVSDVAEAFYLAAKSDVRGEFMNVGSADEQSINRLAELLGGPVCYLPKRSFEADRSLAGVKKIKEKLQWEAKTSFEEGVRLLLRAVLK